MKQSELKTCADCGKGVMHTGHPLFWKFTVTRFCIDMAAVQRRVGLEMMLGGNAVLAGAMGPNEDIAEPVNGPTDILLCEMCAMKLEYSPIIAASLGEDGEGGTDADDSRE